MHAPSIEQLNAKIEQTERQLQQLVARRSQLLDWMNAHKEIKTMEKFTIQSLPEIIVASHREVIPDYAALGTLCVEKIGPEMQRLGCKCPPPGYCFTIEHNKEYHPNDLDIEYCEQVEEFGADNEIIQFKRLAAVHKVLCMKHVGPYERFYESFAEAFAYIEEQGYTIIDSSPSVGYAPAHHHPPRRRQLLRPRQPPGAKDLGFHHPQRGPVPAGRTAGKQGGFQDRISGDEIDAKIVV